MIRLLRLKGDVFLVYFQTLGFLIAYNDKKIFIILFQIYLILVIALLVVDVLPRLHKEQIIRKLSREAPTLTPQRVRKIHANFSKNDSYQDKYDFQGMYICYNQTKNKYFVGAGDHVMDGVLWHLNGNGYIDVYADLQNGDHWLIHFIRLKDTPYDNIESLWYAGINIYRSDKKRRGYN